MKAAHLIEIGQALNEGQVRIFGELLEEITKAVIARSGAMR
jgi:hypothetical protein